MMSGGQLGLQRVIALALLLLAALGLTTPLIAADRQYLAKLTILVPGSPGGGYDLTAQAMKETLEAEQLVGQVEIVHYPGGGGSAGLARFASAYRGRGDAVLLGGLFLLGATATGDNAVSLDDVQPIARLTGDWGVMAVPAKSPLRTIADLERALRADPAAVRFAGGAMGGADQGLVWSFAAKIGVPFDALSYYSRSGGRRVAEAVLGGGRDVGVSGYAEFAPYVASGRMRILAVAAPSRFVGLDVPTLRESGIKLDMLNWRAVFVARGLDEDTRLRLGAVMAAMRVTARWQRLREKHHWRDQYLAGPALDRFIAEEQRRWPAVIDPPLTRIAAGGTSHFQGVLAWIASLLLSLGGLTASIWRRRQSLAADIPAIETDAPDEPVETAGGAGKVIRAEIDDNFEEWNLSDAERDIAWFMLRGLPMQEIADLRGTSERTVRQQAQAIYRKAGLDGRSDFSGRVLERFI